MTARIPSLLKPSVVSVIKEEIRLLRNREVRIFFVFSGLVSLCGSVICFVINIWAGITALLASSLIMIASVYFTRWRYRQIEDLASYLRRIAAGEYSLDIRDNDEGELSILKSEIYKVTITLLEQTELLKKDKLFLADSLSDISHQLKTPLTSLFVMTDLISDPGLPPDKRVEFTQNIRSQLERMQWLVSSLLKLSKIDAGSVEFRKDRVNVKKLIAKATEHLKIPMEIKEQALEITGDEDTGFTGDFNWSAEAIANIIKNCMEHTPPGGKISVDFSETPIYTLIRISDNGEGIDKEDLPRIFNRFYKGKNAHNDSIGIGLAMSRSIFEKQGGTIQAISEKNKGTEFAIRIYKGVV